ncbi:Imm63 domain-containing protein [Pseudomonas sp. IT-P100]
MNQQELAQHLKRQIIFLRNSVAAYDQGSHEEALRIAVVIRVLFYDTRSCTSLLKHMGRKDTLQLVTTAKDLPPNFPRPLEFGELLSGMVFGETIHYAPISAGSPTLACPDWWSQPVLIRDDAPYTRGDVVRAAAHKDGGAHVDEPDVHLKALREGFWMKEWRDARGLKVRESIGDTHFRMLRRFADELLHSPNLLALIT